MKTQKQFFFLLNYTSIGVNSISILMGIIYFFIPQIIILWQIFGVFLLINLGLNFYVAYIAGEKINKQNSTGKKIRIIGYIYLFFAPIALFLMNMGNMIISVPYSNRLIDNFGSYFMVILGFFGLILLFLFQSLFVVFHRNNEDIWLKEETKINISNSEQSKLKSGLKRVIGIFSIINIIIGLIVALIVLVGSKLHLFGFVGVAVPQFGIAWGVLFCSSTLIILKLKKVKETFASNAILSLGIILVVITLLPSFSIPFTINNASKNFDASFNPIFNGDWRSQIPPDIESYFLKFPFHGTQYYLGQKPKECTVLQDILFFNGSQSSFEVDKNILLYFDAYLPPNVVGLPGENSVLIRLHGGGWSFGDKGLTNMMQVNKYFAAQGYVVFDIQYGMYDTGGSNPLTPEYVKGNFTKVDIVRHVGNFTHFLAEHAEDYGANLDSVFISGNSAGGQLALVAALGIASGSYYPILNSSFHINGVIPYYPANRISDQTNPINNPGLLVDSSSPACLIYQGTHDALVQPIVSEQLLQDYLDSGNPNCSLLLMPFSGHANDFYFSGSYNQIFLYFMERFMYLFH